MKLRMGTRGSPLALAQSGAAARALRALNPGLEIETVVIKTSGDLFGAVSQEKAKELAQGVKGLFVKEIEEALLAGTIDFAVHSAKDLPAQLAPGLVIAAYPEREDPRDVLISRDGARFANLKLGAILGTSSLRRKIQLQMARPDLRFVPMRGNVDTRLKKLQDGVCDGIILAAAGLKRLGRADVARELLETAVVLPAPAQGALALEARADRSEICSLVATFDHAPTRIAVELERAFLKAAGGGCSTPLAALARPERGGAWLDAFWSKEDGSGAARLGDFCADVSASEAFVFELARRIVSGG